MTDDALTSNLHEAVPFARRLGIKLLASTRDEVRGRVDWSEDSCTSAGVMHGGVIMSLADTCNAMCAFLNLPEGAVGTTTIESKTNFFRAVRSGYVEARTMPLHAGRTTIVLETDVVDDQDRRVARTIQTQAVLHPRES